MSCQKVSSLLECARNLTEAETKLWGFSFSSQYFSKSTIPSEKNPGLYRICPLPSLLTKKTYEEPFLVFREVAFCWLP